MCDCDYDQPTFFNCKTVKGRKDYRCCECLRDIAKGERHEYVSGLWDGHMDDFRTCSDCVQMRGDMELDCWCYGQLMEDVSQGDYDHIESVVAFAKRRKENYECLATKT